jgi:hypothetical protein
MDAGAQLRQRRQRAGVHRASERIRAHTIRHEDDNTRARQVAGSHAGK